MYRRRVQWNPVASFYYVDKFGEYRRGRLPDDKHDIDGVGPSAERLEKLRAELEPQFIAGRWHDGCWSLDHEWGAARTHLHAPRQSRQVGR